MVSELQEKLKQYNIILASQSPRRKDLLNGLGIKYSIKLKKDIQEIYPQDLPKESVAEYLSKLKFNNYLDEAADNDLFITADTIVCIENEILGKPKNIEEAKLMLKKLSGKTHKVVSGVTFGTKKNHHSFSVKTEVTFKELSETEINYYIETYQPLDKAGAYGVQEWIGFIGVTHIDGSYYNIMGLPIQHLYEKLLNF